MKTNSVAKLVMAEGAMSRLLLANTKMSEHKHFAFVHNFVFRIAPIVMQ